MLPLSRDLCSIFCRLLFNQHDLNSQQTLVWPYTGCHTVSLSIQPSKPDSKTAHQVLTPLLMVRQQTLVTKALNRQNAKAQPAKKYTCLYRRKKRGGNIADISFFLHNNDDVWNPGFSKWVRWKSKQGSLHHFTATYKHLTWECSESQSKLYPNRS